MRRTRVLVAVVVLALAWASAGVMYAITNGQPDGNRHPYVGFLAFYWNVDDAAPSWFCSGSLIAETVVLTAGHCTEGAGKAEVWFDADVAHPAGPPVEGVPRTHPDFTRSWLQGLLGWPAVDTGVVVLNEAVTDRGFAALPDVGVVDTLPMKTNVDLVGYGMQMKLQQSGPPYYRWVANGQRFYAPSQIVASDNRNDDMWLRLTANPANDKGGTCYGDSGGPSLLGGTNTILGTISFGSNTNCAGLNYANRVDREVVLTWVRSFLD
jgi:Trypsin